MAAPQKLTAEVQTLTPVWTGDAAGKTSYLKATSFVGGLRFWGEALLRSLGEKTCDITDGNNRCLYDTSTGQTKICPACEVFGCTGKGRSFLFRILNEDVKDESMKTVQLSCREHPKLNKFNKPIIDKKTGSEKTEVPRYLDGKPGLAGSFQVQLVPNRPGEISPVVAAALVLILRWGALGARDQYGFGFVNAEPLDNSSLLKSSLSIIDKAKGKDANVPNRASLRDFFFFTSHAQFKDDEKHGNTIEHRELPFVIRHDVRNRLRQHGKELRHYFAGNVRGGAQGTQYNLGLVAGKTLLGWGWFPRHGTFAKNRDSCLNALRFELISHSVPDTLRWKEFDSPRDNCGSPEKWPEFLTELFKTTWRAE